MLVIKIREFPSGKPLPATIPAFIGYQSVAKRPTYSKLSTSVLCKHRYYSSVSWYEEGSGDPIIFVLPETSAISKHLHDVIASEVCDEV